MTFSLNISVRIFYAKQIFKNIFILFELFIDKIFDNGKTIFKYEIINLSTQYCNKWLSFHLLNNNKSLPLIGSHDVYYKEHYLL